MLSREEVLSSLRRLFSGGKLDLVPKREPDRQMLFALGAWAIHRGQVGTESEVNELLDDWLSTFCVANSLDHVTFRRALVDAGFMGRADDGSRYWINGQQVHRTIAADCLDIHPGEIFEASVQEKEDRRRAYQNRKAANRGETWCRSRTE